MTKKKISNLDIFKSANKIVTFSGTPHIEAVCFGLKPIIISDVTLSALSKKLVLKPKSLNEYKYLILNNENIDNFKSRKLESDFAKKILFITENTLSFSKQLKVKLIYRNDQNIKLIKNLKQTILMFKNKNTRLKLNSSFDYLDTKFKRTFSKKYFKLFKKKYNLLLINF